MEQCEGSAIVGLCCKVKQGGVVPFTRNALVGNMKVLKGPPEGKVRSVFQLPITEIPLPDACGIGT